MWDAVFLSIRLAATTTFILLLTGAPLAYWLARSPRWWKEVIAAIIALPLVLPPTVLGFYLLIALAPQSPLGRAAIALFGQALPFTFAGLVAGSVIYSLPFMVQPLRNGFEAVGEELFEAAATLGSSPLDRFFFLALPLARAGILSGAVLSFAHTMGEFGVVLMIGGNIPGQTRVLSVAIYDYVEVMEWGKAHMLSAGMLIFSFVTILAMTLLERHMRRRAG